MEDYALVYGRAGQAYNFGPDHPFTPLRGAMLTDLLRELDAFDVVIEPDQASREVIVSVHAESYVKRVEAASSGQFHTDSLQFGLGTGDVPVFRGMHDATRWVVGGTLTAARLISSDQVRRALHLAGGLHHAHRNYASGFCVYNDVAVAIRHLLKAGYERIAYLDIDAHHGDGVQALFYEEPRVLTISLHESGQYLFPGTGFPNEVGAGLGLGFALNFPLLPYTDPSSYIQVFDACVPDVLKCFKPQVLVVECGADAHTKDPLAHLQLSSHAFAELYARILALADKYADGRVLMHLGGGYDLDVTARVWAMLALQVQGLNPPERVPQAWHTRWEGRLVRTLQSNLHDTQSVPDAGARIKDENHRMAMQAMENLFAHW